MGACLDRVLIIADAIACGSGECRTFGHEVAPELKAVEIPGDTTASRCCCLLLQRRLLTTLRLREAGQRECIHPLRNDFGSFARITVIVPQSPEAGSYSAAVASASQSERTGSLDNLGHLLIIENVQEIVNGLVAVPRSGFDVLAQDLLLCVQNGLVDPFGQLLPCRAFSAFSKLRWRYLSASIDRQKF